jgi:hypothetical protein
VDTGKDQGRGSGVNNVRLIMQSGSVRCTCNARDKVRAGARARNAKRTRPVMQSIHGSGLHTLTSEHEDKSKLNICLTDFEPGLPI